MPGAMTPGLGLDLLPAQQQQQQRQQLTGQAGQEELGAAEVHLLMAQLQRMEEQENAMRCGAGALGVPGPGCLHVCVLWGWIRACVL